MGRNPDTKICIQAWQRTSDNGQVNIFSVNQHHTLLADPTSRILVLLRNFIHVSFFCQSLVLKVGSASFWTFSRWACATWYLVTNSSNLFTTSFLFTSFERIVRWTMFGHSYLFEFECWHSKMVIYSNTTFIKWCSVVLFRMLIFKEGLESSQTFWTVVLQTKCPKLTEPTILHETTDRKANKKKRRGKNLWLCLQGTSISAISLSPRRLVEDLWCR